MSEDIPGINNTTLAYLFRAEAFYAIHKVVLYAMGDLEKAAVVSELLEQFNMAKSAGRIDKDEWFPCSFRSMSDRLFIPHNKVRTTMNEIKELGLYTSIRKGDPTRTYYKLNTSAFQSLIENGVQAQTTGRAVVDRTINSSSSCRLGPASSKDSKKDKQEHSQPLAGQGASAPVARPSLIKRNQTLQEDKPVEKSPFKNRHIAEIFTYWCDKSILSTHKADPDSKVFQLCQKYISRALKSYKIPEVKKAIDNYCYLLESPGFMPSLKWNKESMPNFFSFDERTRQRYDRNLAPWAKTVDSWFDECIMGVDYMVKKFGNPDHEIDSYPEVTAALIRQYNKHQMRVSGGVVAGDTDKKYFVKAAKTVVELHQRHKNKIVWGGQLAAQRDPIMFAPMMIDARYHFSKDNVTLVKPTWFSSEKAVTFLIDYLLEKGMITRAIRQQIMENKADLPESDLHIRMQKKRQEILQRKRAERVAEEGEGEE